MFFVWQYIYYMHSWELRTISRTRFLKAALSVRHMTAASMLAGESSLGSDNMEITEMMMDSTPKMGRHRSADVSYLKRKINK